MFLKEFINIELNQSMTKLWTSRSKIYIRQFLLIPASFPFHLSGKNEFRVILS